ncbi:MAG TPA: UDP-2,3-diacylglucosamine diphosphatase LpxI [Syntrophobacteraceae bacterium]|nr:UDP-2,3-diacylglucosamine diphosphatase LpxI [Syntrophobacteraceae bacterium]
MRPSNDPLEHPKERIGLIAGAGQFPLLFAHAAYQAGFRVVAVGFDGETHPSLPKYVDEFHWQNLGQFNRLIQTFKKAGVRQAVLAGSINKTKLYARIRPDWRAVKFLSKLRNKKDDFLLRAFSRELESEGIQIAPSTIFLPSLLAPEGIFTRRRPNRQEESDILFGWQTAKALGHLDIGQCIVVRNQAVLAVEGMDGTDATILRGGHLCKEGAVVIKVSKPSQDLRFDVPAVGYDTIATMKRVKARVLVIEAGKTLIFDREKMIEAADEAGITIQALRDEKALEEVVDEGRDSVRAYLNRLDRSRSPSVTGPPPVLVREPHEKALKVAVVGVGYLGRFHAHKYAGFRDANLVAVVDIDPEKARQVAQEVSSTPLADYRELLGQVDAVSIVTPTPQHFSIASDFLAAGVHVLLEKPMTQSLAEADELIRLARENNCFLQIGHLERFNSAFQAVLPRLNRPMFLEAHRLALFNERGLDVDVILDLMIHDIDLVLHMVRSPLKRIRASGVSVLTSVPDIATVRMEFENGATANLTASRISLKNQRKMRIFQENTYLSADYAEKRAYVVYREQEWDEAGFPQLSIEELEIQERDALGEEILSFLDCVRAGKPPWVDGVQGRRALAVALDISRQIEEQLEKGRGEGGS